MKLYQEMFPKATRSDKGQAREAYKLGDINQGEGIKRTYTKVNGERAERCDIGVPRTEENRLKIQELHQAQTSGVELELGLDVTYT